MLFRLENSDIKSSQELIVLCHGQERVLVPLPESYEDAIKVAKQELDLDGELRFVTKDLPGCIGDRVRIHPDAWRGISPLLGSIAVEIVDGMAASHTGRESEVPPAVPSRIVMHEPGAVPPASLLLSAKARRLSRLSGAAPGSHSSPRMSNGPPTPASSTSSSSNKRKMEDRDGDVSYAADMGNAKEMEEVEDDIELPRKGKRTRISDDEGEKEVQIEVKIGGHSQGVRRTPESIALADVLDPEPEPAVENDPKTSLMEEHEASPLSQRKPSPSGHPSPLKGSPVPNGERSPVYNREHGHLQAPFVPIKEEPVAPTQSEPPNSQIDEPVSQPCDDGSDDRFVVTIEYEDGESEDNKSLFKTRGRHLVSKVLMQACRTFGIRHLYDKAELILVVEAEDGGEIVDNCFICAPEDTMARAGAEPNSRFLVHICENDEEDCVDS